MSLISRARDACAEWVDAVRAYFGLPDTASATALQKGAEHRTSQMCWIGVSEAQWQQASDALLSFLVCGGTADELDALARARARGAVAHEDQAKLKFTATPVSEQQIVTWFSTHSSSAIQRILSAGQEVIDERFADGVFE